MKTIAEQFYTEWMGGTPGLATKRAIERLEARIAAIEDWQSRPIEDAMQSQVDSLTAQLIDLQQQNAVLTEHLDNEKRIRQKAYENAVLLEAQLAEAY